MKKTILTIALIFVSSYAVAQQSGGSGSHGGVGPKVNGRVMTFHSANFFVAPQPLPASEIPGMIQFQKALSDCAFLDSNTLKTILSALNPAKTRLYYRVLPEMFNEEVYKKLIQEYVRLTQLPEDQLNLFAVTDPDKKITYLLPSFYSLATTEEQQAILFHESSWIIKPKATYRSVVEGEIYMQAYLENPENTDRITALADYLDGFLDTGSRIRLGAAIAVDLKNPELEKQGFIKKWFNIGSNYSESRYILEKNLPDYTHPTVYETVKEHFPYEFDYSYIYIEIDKLFGERFFSCFERGGIFYDCADLISRNLLELKQQHQGSQLIDFFLEQANHGKIRLTAYFNRYGAPLDAAEFRNGDKSIGSGRYFSKGNDIFDLHLKSSLSQFMKQGKLILDREMPIAQKQLGANMIMSPITSEYQFYIYFK